MADKPSYEELEKRLRVLERTESERKKAESKLRESEEKYRRIFENSVAGFYRSTPAGRFLDVNPALANMLRYDSPEDLVSSVSNIAKQVYATFEDRDCNQKAFQDRGYVENFEIKARCKDGSEIWFYDSARAYYRESGEIAYYEGVVVDITRRKQVEQALHERIEILGRMLDEAPASITIHDDNGQFLYANRKTLELHGYQDREEFLAVNLHKLDVPESAELLEKRFRIIREEGESKFEVAHYRKDGSNFPLEVLVKVIEWQGRPSMLSIASDITDRKHAEEALRESEEKHRRLFETMAHGVIYQSKDGSIISANPAAERILGLPFDQMCGKTFMDLRWKMIREDGSTVPGTEDPLMVAVRTGRTIGPVIRGVFHPEKDTYIWLSITAIPLFQPGKTVPFQAYATFEDITERKRAEDKLSESERRLRQIIEFLPDATFVIDTEGKVSAWNNAIHSLTGIKASDMLGKGDYLYAVPFYGKPRPILIDMVISKDKEMPFSYSLFHREGDRLFSEVYLADFMGRGPTWLWVTASPLYNPDGQIVGAIESIRDITERKHAEEERKKLEAQLVQAQKMESVGRLAGGVAHDFNNMLGIILGYTEMAMEHAGSVQTVHADLQEIRKAAKRSADLVRQLLTFARKQTITPEILDFNKTVEGMLKMLRRLIGEDIHLVWRPGAGQCPVNMDPTQIDQILANLCVNARDAIDGVGKVTIETGSVTLDEDDCNRYFESLPGDYVLLAVSDNGCGMDKEVLGKLYEPFFTTKEVGKGTGLGLPTVYGIVKQNGGFINVYSEPGQGTTFRIYIPRHMGEAEKEQKQASDKGLAGGQETILLVEDEPSLLKMGKVMLERLGYTVLPVGTPTEAVRIADERRGDIHLLITDVIMPEMNGRELADQFSADYPNMKLLFMSGYTADVIAHHGVLDPGVKFVQKPFSMKDLANKIREALEN